MRRGCAGSMTAAAVDIDHLVTWLIPRPSRSHPAVPSHGGFLAASCLPDQRANVTPTKDVGVLGSYSSLILGDQVAMGTPPQ